GCLFRWAYCYCNWISTPRRASRSLRRFSRPVCQASITTKIRGTVLRAPRLELPLLDSWSEASLALSWRATLPVTLCNGRSLLTYFYLPAYSWCHLDLEGPCRVASNTHRQNPNSESSRFASLALRRASHQAFSALGAAWLYRFWQLQCLPFRNTKLRRSALPSRLCRSLSLRPGPMFAAAMTCQ